MRYSNLKRFGTAVLPSSFSCCNVLVAIVAALLAAPPPASAAAPEIAVFTGNTTNAAAARTNGALYIFPDTAIGYGSTITFTIQNVGDTNLSGLALSQAGNHLNDYELSALSATDLPPNATATFSATFEPTAEGLRTAAILIDSNDADENPFRIRLNGTGTPLQITQQPADTSAYLGSTAQFTVFAGPTASYQWQRKLPGATTFVDIPLNIPGATSSNFVTAPMVPANHGTAYRARVAKVFTSVFSAEALLSVNVTDSPADASIPGDLVTATSTNSPASQGSSKAIDNNLESKYLNFDKLDTGLTITPFGKCPVRALTLISAEDEPARDPSSFLLEGSNDGTNFTRIASNAVPEFPARNFIQSFAVANTNVFNQYRLLFPTIASAAAANSMQIAEVELLCHEEITSPNDDVRIDVLPNAVEVRSAGFLFDRQLEPERKLEVQFMSMAHHDIVVNLTLAAGAKVLKGFELIGAADDFTYPERRPSYVTVAGSTDGNDYTDLATVVPAAPSSNLQIQEFSTLSNTAAFARYRIVFGPPVEGNTLQVGEVRLFGDVALPSLSIRAGSSNVLVSWPNVSGFNLESKAALTNANWTSVANTPVLNNGVNTVTLPTSSSAAFFRLRR